MSDAATTSQILMICITAAITGALSSIGTIAALKTHILYIKETLARHEREFARVHTRIDEADPACHFSPASGAHRNLVGGLD